MPYRITDEGILPARGFPAGLPTHMAASGDDSSSRIAARPPSGCGWRASDRYGRDFAPGTRRLRPVQGDTLRRHFRNMRGARARCSCTSTTYRRRSWRPTLRSTQAQPRATHRVPVFSYAAVAAPRARANLTRRRRRTSASLLSGPSISATRSPLPARKVKTSHPPRATACRISATRSSPSADAIRQCPASCQATRRVEAPR